MEITRLSAWQLADLVRKKVISPKEVLDQTFEAIGAVNPKINAFVSLRQDAAYKEAEVLEKRIIKGEARGLLLGVPVGVKDLEDVEGMVTSFGCPIFKDNIARRDSIQVARLKAQGAIVVGKTNTPEFGFTGFTKNRLFGTTRNPWALDRTPGGSSGGSAAAVASFMVPLCTGSDAGGSIRIPASYCGCVGIKPTFGTIPMDQGMGFGGRIWTLGPLAREVRDAALYLKATMGLDPKDPESMPSEKPPFKEKRPEFSKLRIAYSMDLGSLVVEEQVLACVEKALKVFQKMGHEVFPCKVNFVDTKEVWWKEMATDLAFQLRDVLSNHKDQLNRAMVASIEALRDLKYENTISLREVRNTFYYQVQSVLERADVIITPTMPTVAFGAEGPPPSRIEGKEVELLDVVGFTYPFNLSGHPCISIRAGLTKQGLPVGLQIVGPKFREWLIVSLAYQFERETGCHQNYPIV